jgi:hypothetical protein
MTGMRGEGFAGKKTKKEKKGGYEDDKEEKGGRRKGTTQDKYYSLSARWDPPGPTKSSGLALTRAREVCSAVCSK